MSVVGSLIFCTDCGNLLDSIVDQTDSLDCDRCGQQYPTKGRYFAYVEVSFAWVSFSGGNPQQCQTDLYMFSRCEGLPVTSSGMDSPPPLLLGLAPLGLSYARTSFAFAWRFQLCIFEGVNRGVVLSSIRLEFRMYANVEFANLEVVTRSSTDAFPSILKSRRSVVKSVLQKNEIEEGATVGVLRCRWMVG
jgi:hypothetical protein